MAQLKAEIDKTRTVTEVDIQKDSANFESSSFHNAMIANNQKEAQITVLPRKIKAKYGLRQPHVRAPGRRITTFAFSMTDPTNIIIGTADGPISLYKVGETGLKGDATKPLASFNSENEVKAIKFHPQVSDLFAAGLRNGTTILLDTKLEKPLVELKHQRPINDLAWSSDGKLLAVLYVDMTIKIWDVRGNNVVIEKKIVPTRGVGFIETFYDNTFIVSFVENNKQTLIVYDLELNEVKKVQFDLKAMPLTVRPTFLGLTVVHANHESKLQVLDKELNSLITYTAPNAFLGFTIDPKKPDADKSEVLEVTIFNTNQTTEVLAITGDIEYLPYPVHSAEYTAAEFLSGKDFVLNTEAIAKTVKEEVKKEEVVDVGPTIVTKFRFLNAMSDPPREYYINLQVGSNSNPEFNEVCTNGKQFAFIGHGSPNPIYVIPLNKPGKISTVYPTISSAHQVLTSYLSFCPYKPSLLASSGEDGKIRLWEVPDELKESMTESVSTFSMKKRVGVFKFSEAVRNLIVAASYNEIGVWDLNKEEMYQNMQTKVIQDIALDSLSQRLFTVTNEGNFDTFDPRSGQVVKSLKTFTGSRLRRILYLPDFDYVATFGGTKRNDRALEIFDSRSETPLKTVEIDNSSGQFLPMYEEGVGVIYVGGKGDGNIYNFEVCKDDRVIASNGQYDTIEPERGLCLLPKSNLNIMNVEVSKMIKLTHESMRNLHWHCPRKMTEYFQDDIFLPTRDTSSPLMEVIDWADGQSDVFPTLNLQPPGTKKVSEIPKQVMKGKYNFKEETVERKPTDFTIEAVVAAAPTISSSSSSENKEEESESW